MFLRRKKKDQDPRPRRGPSVNKEMREHPLVRLDHELKQLVKKDENAVRKSSRH
jgi:hypothetical protein